MKEYLLYLVLGIIMTFQILIYLEMHYTNQALTLTLAGVPLNSESIITTPKK
jgi:hypothetical protein